MPYANTITLPAKVWTPITSGALTVLRVDPRGDQELELQATVGLVPPGEIALGSVIIDRPVFIKLAEIFPGVVGANVVYARPAASMSVSVQHD